MDSVQLQTVVDEALDNATDNGFFIELHLENSIEEVAVDLASYCAEVEDVPIDQLKPCIEKWRANHAIE